VSVYRTPGGQRRYSEDDLARFLVSMRKPAFRRTVLAAPEGDLEISILELVEGGNTTDLETKADAKEFKDRVAAAVEGLSESERLVIALSSYYDLSLLEIAEVLGLTESRVSQLLSDAVTHIRSKVPAATRTLS
jgi:RNA polymerase sigma factor for flagellar operon FliA